MRGTIKSFAQPGWGLITAADSGGDLHFYASEALRFHLGPGDEGVSVDYEIFEDDRGPHARILTSGSGSGGDRPRLCFVVMPHGRSAEEVRWFEGWYEHVIAIAVKEAGYEPILAANQDAPSAINDEIRTHLTFDPMVVVDLGGRLPTDAPNPNVMYELGIRHALNLPLVMMAWTGQTLPFDISNQRVLMERRELIDLGINRDRLVRFLREAENGNYYKPMDAVGRHASLRLAENLDRDSVLASLIKEVRALRTQVDPPRARFAKPPAIPRLGRQFTKKVRSHLKAIFLREGGSPGQWEELAAWPVDETLRTFAQGRNAANWEPFVAKAAELLAQGNTIDKALAVALEASRAIAQRPNVLEVITSSAHTDLVARSVALLSGAIKEKSQVRAMYDSHLRQLCPHQLGERGGKYYCLFYQFAGATSKGEVGLDVAPGWRCLPLDRLEIVAIEPGPWHGGPDITKSIPCIERVLAEAAP